ncbi:VOC family protein [Schumannella luteola]|uniref:VOC domain-containing protein n=1 Tax=Schumannella luteola TaxID=472059 RepID=A0A852YC33_9MICO|nr:VOC family protein [Schumannella luteola]NYG99402.1 hypothetical protein [Schumannella luteola]TPX06124.1 glyoxalase [Schumannella luteola]
MPNPIVHAEIIGRDPGRLRRFYGELFGWDAPPGSPVAAAISDGDSYALNATPATATPVPIGIGGGGEHPAQVIFYVGVEDVAAVLARAVELGGAVHVPPRARPDGALLVAQFHDPEGNLVGLAGPAG